MMNTIDTSTIDTSTIDNKKRPNKKTFGPDTIPFLLSTLLFSFIQGRNNGHKPPNFQKWALTMDRMIRLDKRPPCGIMNAICWSQHHEQFWQNVILSANNLRKHYDRIIHQMTSITQFSKSQQLALKNAMAAQKALESIQD